jgi:hypothetical protein
MSGMGRGPCSFKQRDVSRAIKGAVAAGLAVGRVEISKDGNIIIIPESAQMDSDAETLHNEWDEGITKPQLRHYRCGSN